MHIQNAEKNRIINQFKENIYTYSSTSWKNTIKHITTKGGTYDKINCKTIDFNKIYMKEFIEFNQQTQHPLNILVYLLVDIL